MIFGRTRADSSQLRRKTPSHSPLLNEHSLRLYATTGNIPLSRLIFSFHEGRSGHTSFPLAMRGSLSRFQFFSPIIFKRFFVLGAGAFTAFFLLHASNSLGFLMLDKRQFVIYNFLKRMNVHSLCGNKVLHYPNERRKNP